MTATVRKAVEDMTGDPVDVCPWYAMRDPFVQSVVAAMPFFESGQLAFRLPHASHRLVMGIGYYHTVSERVFARQMKLEEEQRKREQAKPAAGKVKRHG